MRSIRLVVDSAIVTLGTILEERRLFIHLRLGICERRLLTDVALGNLIGSIRGGGKAGGDDVLAEASRVNAHILDASEA